MQISTEKWTLEKLVKIQREIDPKPQYQRTPVWKPAKKRLLIDSILRGYDIPKFYLSKVSASGIYKYEVTDGQQRIRGIWEFVTSEFNLDSLKIDGIDLSGMNYSALCKHANLKKRFNEYEITVALIKNATTEEIRMLFARLQMGSSLNPAELRHAMVSNIGNALFAISETHTFFQNTCKISNVRYKHQDYLDNAATLAYYNGKRNIKAVDIKNFYVEWANAKMDEMAPFLRSVERVLSYMERINQYQKGIFKNKWAFVDMFNLLYSNLADILDVKPRNLSDSFSKFEKERKTNNSNPETLIEDKGSHTYDKDLYDYIIAFKTSGSEKSNFAIRYRVMYKRFFNKHNFELK